MGTLGSAFNKLGVSTSRSKWTVSKRRWKSWQMRLPRQSPGLLTLKNSKLKMRLRQKNMKNKSGMSKRRCRPWSPSLMSALKICSTRPSSWRRWRRKPEMQQENNEKQEERLCKATLELAGACKRADAAVKKRIELENEVSSNEEAIDALDKQLEESKFNLSASESKYDDISRKLATLESDAARAAERADAAEKKIADIEEELRVVGQNLQTLEVGEEKTIQREEKYQTEIMDLRVKLKASEYRGEQ